MSKISTDEWLSELGRLSARHDEGLTAREWAEKLGLSVKTTRDRLASAQRAGWLRTGTRTARTISGLVYHVPVYMVKVPKGKERGK